MMTTNKDHLPDYELIKKWLLKNETFTASTIGQEFNIDKEITDELLAVLIADRYVERIAVKSDFYITKKLTLLKEKNINWDNNQFNLAIKNQVKTVEAAHLKSLMLSSYFIPLAEQIKYGFNQTELFQVAHPLYSFIQACNLNLKTAIISDKIDSESFYQILMVALSGLSYEKLISGQLSEKEWQSYISSLATTTLWAAEFVQIERQNFDKVTAMIESCLYKNVEVIIFDFDYRQMDKDTAFQALLKLAKEMKKIIVVGHIVREKYD